MGNPELRFCLMTDGDDHWYVVGVEFRQDFELWIGSPDFKNGVTPWYARRVDLPRLTFSLPDEVYM